MNDKNSTYKKENRLQFEKSPYLLQHAYNPVDWFPWGDEAFEKARNENKPVFLSIGYSTCHWCHVMEHESFEDADIAGMMNETFVCIKVDREERPDIDNIYMTVCQIMTGSGGWPLTIIMTPGKQPFFAGTYFPKTSRYGRIGMVELISRINETWKNQKKKVLESADQIVDHLMKVSSYKQGHMLTKDILHVAFRQLKNRFDDQCGGFGDAPKFPSPHNLTFLLRYWQRTGNQQALEMVEKTLQSMRAGGIYDHLGLGFHRYSTDAEWILPHFEKMLYDQALLAIAYCETYQATGKQKYADTAREIFKYVWRDMTSPEGGFYSAEDADSEGEEGVFYLWSVDEIKKILNESDSDLFIKTYNLATKGNFRDQATGEYTGTNILFLKKPLEKIADEQGISVDVLVERLKEIKKELFEVREKRVRPGKDDKILTDWNGLMIAALAIGARILNEPFYLKSAEKAVNFIMEKMFDSNGYLLHRFRDGEAKINGFLDDYAFLTWGLIELYESSFHTTYLKKALYLNSVLIKHFRDEKEGGFFLTSNLNEPLLIRQKEIYDGAIPSGNSIAILNLIKLGRLVASDQLEQLAEESIRAFSVKVENTPSANTQLLSAFDYITGPSHEIIIVGNMTHKDTKRMIRMLQQEFIPNKVVLFRPDDQKSPAIDDLAKYTAAYKSKENKATAYVCQNYNCKLPATSADEMMELIRRGTAEQ